MSEQSEQDASGRQTSPWAIGFALFAGIVLITVGVFQALEGFVAIVRGTYYVVTPHDLFKYDVHAWGWAHLIIGILLVLVGGGVLRGYLFARIIGIAIAVISAIANFMFIPHYPFWSIVIIALNIVAIWAMCNYGREAAQRRAVRY